MRQVSTQTTTILTAKYGTFFALLGSLLLVALIGCADPNADPNTAGQDKEKTGIIGKTTRDVGEFKEGDEEADLQVKANNPISAATGTYGFAIGQISKMAIQQKLQIFEAINERYPKDHDEFMEKIIKQYNIDLPKLPGGRQYQYDVENHELKVVDKENAQTPDK